MGIGSKNHPGHVAGMMLFIANLNPFHSACHLSLLFFRINIYSLGLTKL